MRQILGGGRKVNYVRPATFRHENPGSCKVEYSPRFLNSDHQLNRHEDVFSEKSPTITNDTHIFPKSRQDPNFRNRSIESHTKLPFSDHTTVFRPGDDHPIVRFTISLFLYFTALNPPCLLRGPNTSLRSNSLTLKMFPVRKPTPLFN
jgi:hypothetical protein